MNAHQQGRLKSYSYTCLESLDESCAFITPCLVASCRSLFNKEFSAPQWVTSLPSCTELVCVQGTRVLREMGGPPDGDTLEFSMDSLSVSDGSSTFAASPLPSVDFGAASTFYSDCIPLHKRAMSSEASGTFTIDTKSGNVYADGPGIEHNYSAPFPLLKSDSTLRQ